MPARVAVMRGADKRREVIIERFRMAVKQRVKVVFAVGVQGKQPPGALVVGDVVTLAEKSAERVKVLRVRGKVAGLPREEQRDGGGFVGMRVRERIKGVFAVVVGVQGQEAARAFAVRDVVTLMEKPEQGIEVFFVCGKVGVLPREERRDAPTARGRGFGARPKGREQFG
ncbi:MAG: hypothetical protein FWF96_00945 [Kiritimatiellaeota bacterium]|nr:hypothetical protein [Kiritimatiellota bacterium]